MISTRLLVTEIMDLIVETKAFDLKKHDQGQWVCRLLYGEKWMESKEFDRDNKTFPELPDEIAMKLLKLKELLLRLKNGV